MSKKMFFLLLNPRTSQTLIPIPSFFSTAANPSSTTPFSPSKFRALLATAESEKRAHVEQEEEEEGEGGEGTVAMMALVDKIEGLNDGDVNRSGGESRDSERKRKGGGLDCYRRELGDWRKKILEHKQLLLQLARSGTHVDFEKRMIKLERFEERNFRIPFGNSGVRKMVDSLNSASRPNEQETPILLRKIDQAMRVLQCRRSTERRNQHSMLGLFNTGEFSGIHGSRDGTLLQKFKDIETKLQPKLNSKKSNLTMGIVTTIPPPRLHDFDVSFIDVYRTSKVIDGRDLTIYNVWLACGNYNGVVGFSKAESSSDLQIAVQRSYEKCSQNLYYIEQQRTIAKPVQSEYENTRVFLWPAPLGEGIKGFRVVRTILSLAGFKDVRSKVVGWKNPQNTIRALLIALNATEMGDSDNDIKNFQDC